MLMENFPITRVYYILHGRVWESEIFDTAFDARGALWVIPELHQNVSIPFCSQSSLMDLFCR